MINYFKKVFIYILFLSSIILFYYVYSYPQSVANVFQACKNEVTNQPDYPGGPLGGGKGYIDIINQSEADYLVNDFNTLENALTNSNDVNGDGKIIIYINDNAIINITNEATIVGDSQNDCSGGQCGLKVPSNVTIASGRARNGSIGALIYTDHFNNEGGKYNIFKVIGSDVRITGLRLKGSDTEIKKNSENDPDWYVYTYTLYRGIVANDNLRVDNCELSGFAHAAILLKNSKGVEIHHNYIHHNRREGLGYGIAHAKKSDSDIYVNIFDYNRHSISGDGHCEQSYTARYNLILWNGNSTGFDMHGNGDDHSECDCDVAGRKVTIKYNTFLIDGASSIRIRGNPVEVCDITKNKFDTYKTNIKMQDWDDETDACGTTLNTDLINYDDDGDGEDDNIYNYSFPSECGYCDPCPCRSDSCLNDECPDHCISDNCDD